jgi:hypothetical protein
MSGDWNTVLSVIIGVIVVVLLLMLFCLLARPRSTNKPQSTSSQSRYAMDTEAHALANTPATDLPPYRAAEAHPVVQSVGGQVVLTMEGGSESDVVRAQQVRALARYEEPSSSRDPRLPALVAQERRALGRHARNDTLATSSTSHLLASVPSASPRASISTTSLESSGGSHQEQDQDQDQDLRAQVWQLREEVERLRTERAAPPQELPPAYHSDAGSARE